MYATPETLSSNTATAAMGSFSPQPTVGNVRLDVPLPLNASDGSLPLTRAPHSVILIIYIISFLIFQIRYIHVEMFL